MNYNIEVTSSFKKQAKKLLKKYPSLKFEILQLISLLEVNPQQGTPIGNDCFKIRLAISS
jgi:mRNA-degrading endonuclease RelE of RelBE toxin-antitoxin system